MRNLKVLWSYLAKHTVSLVAGIVILLVLSAITLVQPYLLRVIIDNLQQGNFLVWLCLVIVGVGLAQLGLGFLQRWAINRTGYQVETELRSDLFAKLQKLDRSYYTETRTGN